MMIQITIKIYIEVYKEHIVFFN